jgi:murein DD-endopeptidase MepM/ murein hydrolase activator NlpD
MIRVLIVTYLSLALSACVLPVREPAGDIASSEELHGTEMGEEFDVTVEKRLNTSGDVIPPQEKALSPVDLKNTIGLSWPVRGRISRGFDLELRKPHQGLDIAAPRGTPILSSHDGIVIYAGKGFKGYGKLVMVEFGDRWATFYSHLSKITVREGQWIKRGQRIGIIGKTGNATGVHLHYELRYNRQAIDPLRYLPTGNTLIAYYR